MKKFKIAMCSLLILTSSAAFAACNNNKTEVVQPGGGNGGEEIPLKQNFDVNKISTSNTSCTYDGGAHIYSVNYDETGVDYSVSYSQTQDGEFKPASELNYVDAGTYPLYYKLSCEGYSDYVSANPVNLTINKRDVRVVVSETKQLVNEDLTTPEVSLYEGETIVQGDRVLEELEFDLNGQEIEQVAGNSYLFKVKGVDGTRTAKNYNIFSNIASYKIVGNIEAYVDNEAKYYLSLQEALNASNVKTIKLNKDVAVASSINITKDLTIDGNGHKILVNSTYSNTIDGSVIKVNSDINLTLKNIIIDGFNKVSCLEVSNGELTLVGVTLTNGKANSAVKAGGLYAKNSTVYVKDAVIQNNDKDVYVDLKATLNVDKTNTGNKIKIGNIFVGADASKTAENNHGTIVYVSGDVENIYLEYDENETRYAGGYGKFSGTISPKLYSQKQDKSGYVELRGKIDQEYVVGGNVVLAETTGGVAFCHSLEEAKQTANRNQKIIRLICDVHGAGLTVNANENVTIDFQGYSYYLETYGFTFNKGSNVQLKNGKIYQGETGVEVMINNYANLTVDNMYLDGGRRYNSAVSCESVLKCLYGSTEITGKTYLTSANNSSSALELYYGSEEQYDEGLTVTFTSEFIGSFKGLIKYGSAAGATEGWISKTKLEIYNGDFINLYNIQASSTNFNIENANILIHKINISPDEDFEALLEKFYVD